MIGENIAATFCADIMGTLREERKPLRFRDPNDEPP
jgi:hypothetical protein